MLIQTIIQGLMKHSSRNVEDLMKTAFKKPRGGNKLKHSTTGRTESSIKASQPYWTGVNLVWDFEADPAALRLNNGGSKFNRQTTDVPYGQFTSPGGESAYIKALIIWCKRKYGLSEQLATRMAFKVAQSASDRGRTVKNPGWFNEIEDRVFKQIMSDISAVIALNIGEEINKKLKGNK